MCGVGSGWDLEDAFLTSSWLPLQEPPWRSMDVSDAAMSIPGVPELA